MPVIKKDHYISQYFMEPQSSRLIPEDSHRSTKARRELELNDFAIIIIIVFFLSFVLTAGLCKCKVNLKECQFIKSAVQ